MSQKDAFSKRPVAIGCCVFILALAGCKSTYQTNAQISSYTSGSYSPEFSRPSTNKDLIGTNGPLDFAVNNSYSPLSNGKPGFDFFVVALPNGEDGFIRSGTFKLGATGVLVTQAGLSLVPQIALPKDATGINIRGDGLVLYRLPGHTDLLEAGRITLARFDNPQALSPRSDGTYAATSASGNPKLGQAGIRGYGLIVQGVLERQPIN